MCFFPYPRQQYSSTCRLPCSPRKWGVHNYGAHAAVRTRQDGAPGARNWARLNCHLSTACFPQSRPLQLAIGYRFYACQGPSTRLVRSALSLISSQHSTSISVRFESRHDHVVHVSARHTVLKPKLSSRFFHSKAQVAGANVRWGCSLRE